jgi:hypothetical protein
MINRDLSNVKVEYKLKDNKLKVYFPRSIYIVEHEIEKLQTPADCKVKVYVK